MRDSGSKASSDSQDANQVCSGGEKGVMFFSGALTPASFAGSGCSLSLWEGNTFYEF